MNANSIGFTIPVLMELAGLSVAQAIHDAFRPDRNRNIWPGNSCPTPLSVLVCAGPGNNGGDGMVVARHLHHFGYKISGLYYPKVVEREPFQGLVLQLKSLGIQIFNESEVFDRLLAESDIVIDAVFGFSFTGNSVREPFDTALRKLANSGKRIVSIDIPSGWCVDGPSTKNLIPIEPDVLISLTAPKLCAKEFKGRCHYLGGRFIPRWLGEKYGIESLAYLYKESDQFVLLE